MTSRKAVVRTIDFRILPRPGTELALDGQRFVVVGSMLHQRRDGQQVPLILWRGVCAHCGGPFDLSTPLKAKYLNRRCPAHHAPGVPVAPKVRQRQRKLPARRAPSRAAR